MHLLHTLKTVASRWTYWLLFVVLMFVTSFIFIWFFSLDVIVYVVSAELATSEKVGFFMSSLSSVYSDITSLYSMVFVFFSMVFALNLTLLVYLAQRVKDPKHSLGVSTTATALLGAGCVACTGSILVPLLTTFGIGGIAAFSTYISVGAFALASIFGLFNIRMLLTRIYLLDPSKNVIK